MVNDKVAILSIFETYDVQKDTQEDKDDFDVAHRLLHLHQFLIVGANTVALDFIRAPLRMTSPFFCL